MSFYNFNKIKINALKVKTKEQIFSELSILAKRIVVIAPDAKIINILNKTDEFPNMLLTCNDRSPVYCKNNKLLITSNKLKELLYIMTDDILNPFKQKWMFNIIFTDQIINYFKFKRREYENIKIEIQ